MTGRGVARRQVCHEGFIPGGCLRWYGQESGARRPRARNQGYHMSGATGTTLCSYCWLSSECMGTLAPHYSPGVT